MSGHEKVKNLSPNRPFFFCAISLDKSSILGSTRKLVGSISDGASPGTGGAWATATNDRSKASPGRRCHGHPSASLASERRDRAFSEKRLLGVRVVSQVHGEPCAAQPTDHPGDGCAHSPGLFGGPVRTSLEETVWTGCWHFQGCTRRASKGSPGCARTPLAREWKHPLHHAPLSPFFPVTPTRFSSTLAFRHSPSSPPSPLLPSPHSLLPCCFFFGFPLTSDAPPTIALLTRCPRAARSPTPRRSRAACAPGSFRQRVAITPSTRRPRTLHVSSTPHLRAASSSWPCFHSLAFGLLSLPPQ